MKSNIQTYLFLAVLLFVISSCREYHITTSVNNDGSIERTVLIKSDSKNEDQSDEIFNFDKTWKKTESENPDDSLKYIVTYSKKFESVDDLNSWLMKNSRLKIEAALEEKFGWFYSYFTYTEIYKKTNPFKQLPFENYMTEEDIKNLTEGNINEELSQKLDKYGAACMLNELFDSLSVKMKKYPQLDPGLLKQNENRISEVLSKGGDELTEFMDELESIYKTDIVRQLRDDAAVIIEKIENKAQALWDIQSSITNEIIMPGLLLDTNSKIIEGNKLTWKFEAAHFTYVDYRMTAQSRVANTWAMILTGAIVFALVLLLIYSVFKKRIRG